MKASNKLSIAKSTIVNFNIQSSSSCNHTLGTYAVHTLGTYNKEVHTLGTYIA